MNPILRAPRKRTIRLAGLLVFALLALLACRKDASDSAPVRIGVIAYMEGDMAFSEGIPTVNAAELAIKDLESRGGLVVNGRKRAIELVVEEIAQSQEASVAATRELINRQGVMAIVGPQYSSDAIPSGAIAEQSRIPMICPVSTNPATTAGRKYVFRMSFLDPAQGGAMATMARDDLKAKRAAILFDESDEYSSGIATVFREVFSRSGDVVAYEGYVPDDDNMAQIIARIGTSHPDVIFLPSYHTKAAGQASLIRELGIRATLLGADGWEQRLVTTMPAFDGAYFSAHWFPQIQTDKAKAFQRNYVGTFNLVPNGTAALTYDAFQLLFAAMEQQQNVEPESIQAGLLALGPYEGVSGTIDFIDSGDPKKNIMIIHVKDGSLSFFRYGTY